MKYKWTILLMLFLIACQSEQTTISEKDFATTISLKEKPIAVKELLNVRSFLVKNDLLIVQNDRQDSIFMGINIHSGHCDKAWGRKGQGPDEYLYPRLINLGENEFEIINFGKKNIINVQLPSYQLEKKKLEKMSDFPLNIVSVGENKYVYDVTMPRKQHLFVWNYGEKPQLIYTFPDLKEKYKNSSVYNGYVTASGKNNRIVYVYQYLRRFDILDFSGKLINSIEVTPNKSAEFQSNGNVDHGNSMTYYMGVKSTDKFIYLYYVGYTGDELQDNLKVPTYIEQYDWDGKPIKRYKIDRFIFDFDIKSENSFIGLDSYSEDKPFIKFVAEK